MSGASFRPTMGRSADTAERRTLVVGRGISVQGVVQDAERLVVEGTVEATMINATELSIAQGGIFKGEVEVEEAEIAGTIDGTLTARHALIVRATGRVLGTARCRRLQVEDGGQITGRIGLAGCSGTPQPVAAAATGAADAAVPVTLVGSSARGLQADLGTPALRRIDGSAQVWLYDSPVCRLNVILYPGPGGAPAVSAAMPMPRGVSQSTCVESLMRERGAGRV
jgi:cytoskeletal protein CcmA (bactofilin family)